jgi:hypothetical protein
VEGSDPIVGDHGAAAWWHRLCGKLPGAFQQPVPDEDLIGRILQGNGNGGG